MKRIVRQVLGVDVAQKELVVCLGRMHDDLSADLYAHKTFPNTAKGFVLLVEWVKKLTHSNIAVRYVMEPTGVYHEALAYFLSDHGMEVSIVLPNKISNYARSLTIKTVTDRTASEAITRFGLERSLDLWKKPLPIYKSIKQLTRERDQIIAERTIVKNQQHAELSEAHPAESTLQRIHKRLVLLNNQEKEISVEISMLIKTDPKVESQMQLLCSLPGVGTLTAATVLAETNGFDLIRNKRQLASYAGLDVKEKRSGSSVQGKPQISKRGNRFIRKAMHMPALAAIRHDERFKAIFVRLVSKHGIKMKAAVAIQRKLLELMFTLYKTQEKYDINHFKKLEAVPMDRP